MIDKMAAGITLSGFIVMIIGFLIDPIVVAVGAALMVIGWQVAKR